MSVTLDFGSRMRLAPASKATCLRSAQLRTRTIVPPRPLSSSTARCGYTGLAKAAKQTP